MTSFIGNDQVGKGFRVFFDHEFYVLSGKLFSYFAHTNLYKDKSEVLANPQVLVSKQWIFITNKVKTTCLCYSTCQLRRLPKGAYIRLV